MKTMKVQNILIGLILVVLLAVTAGAQTAPPVLDPIGAQVVDEGQTLQFRVSSSDLDGTTPILSTSTLPANAVFVDSLNGAGSFTFSPDFTQAGPITVTFYAADAVTIADTASELVTITVNNVNRKPALVVPGAQVVDEGQTLNFGVSASDPDGGTPVLSAINLPTNATFTDLTNGTGTLAFSPDFTQAGPYTVSFIASDGSLADTQTVAITVNNINRKPALVVPGAQVVDEGQTLNFGVSASDPDGGTPVLSAINLPTNATFTDLTNGTGTLAFSPDFTQAGPYHGEFHRYRWITGRHPDRCDYGEQYQSQAGAGCAGRAPMPWMMRQTTMAPRVWESPHAMEAMVKLAMLNR